MDSPAKPIETRPRSRAWLVLVAGLGLLAVVISFASFAPSSPYAKSSGKVVELTSANWQKEVVESELPVVVDFGATWCEPCRRLAPIVLNLADTYSGRVKFAKLDVGEAADVAEKFTIPVLPYVMIFKRGKLAARPVRGFASEKELRHVIDEFLRNDLKQMKRINEDS